MDAAFETVNINYLLNPKADTADEYPPDLAAQFDPALFAQAQAEIPRWQSYEATPLYALTALAEQLGVAGVYYKDEGQRFEPGSFKSLGGAYAVQNLLAGLLSDRMGHQVTLEDIRSGRFKDAASEVTVATATDGNHGRSVAWGAKRFGCPCKIYVHANVSQGRCDAMAAYGAEVVRVAGNYDDSVHQAAADAAAHGWHIVSDTSYPGYTELPRHVMAGYTVMMREMLDQLPARDTATHIFIQGGCGGLAGAVCAYLWHELAGGRPRCAIIEPVQADCLFVSGKKGEQSMVNITEESLMAGLSCGEVSTIAWNVIQRGVNDFLSMHDDLIGPTMKLLAEGEVGAPPIVAGESAVAGLAALIAACRQPELKEMLGLDESSEILLLGTEGATDPDIYRQLVGRAADEV